MELDLEAVGCWEEEGAGLVGFEVKGDLKGMLMGSIMDCLR